MKKVLFLDIDGVLNNIASMAEGVEIVPEKVLLIRDVIEATGARIVISSTWRMGLSKDTLAMILGFAGMRRHYIIDVTPELPNKTRGHEIDQWLVRNPEYQMYAIIDDDSDMLDSQKPYFVQTSAMAGITTLERQKLIDILKEL